MVRGGQVIISNAYGEWCSKECFEKSEKRGFKNITDLLSELASLAGVVKRLEEEAKVLWAECVAWRELNDVINNRHKEIIPGSWRVTLLLAGSVVGTARAATDAMRKGEKNGT